MLDALIWLITEIGAPVAIEVIAEFGLLHIISVPGRRGTILWLLTSVAAGLSLGGISRRVYPQPLLPALRSVHYAFPVVASIAAGALMHWIGRMRQRGGRHRTRIASFWGGAVPVVFYSLVRTFADHR